MKRISKLSLIFLISMCILIPAPCASAKSTVAKDILEIAGAQVLVGLIGPLFGLGPKKTKEQKEKGEKEKKEKKEDKEIKKAEKEKKVMVILCCMH